MVLGRLLKTGLLAGIFVATPAFAKSEPVSVKRLTPCRSGAPEPATSLNLRATPTARCPYDLDNLYQRIGNLLQKGPRSYNATSAALTFGLRAMIAQYDSDRSASYQMRMDGEGGWSMLLWVRESAYPLDGKPSAFAPGVQPRRLIEINALDIRYDITIMLPAGTAPGRCLTVADAAAELTHAGWTDATSLAGLSVRDGGVADPTFKAAKGGTTIILAMQGRGHVATQAERAAQCVTDITVIQPPLRSAQG